MCMHIRMSNLYYAQKQKNDNIYTCIYISHRQYRDVSVAQLVVSMSGEVVKFESRLRQNIYSIYWLSLFTIIPLYTLSKISNWSPHIFYASFESFVLFDLILYVPSTIFQLNRDGSSCVEPVLG